MEEKMKKSAEQRWSEDEFGVVTWGSRKIGDTLHHRGHDPFEQMIEILDNSPGDTKRAAIAVHDDLNVARSIAVSIFGKHWREHVMDVFDRMRQRRLDDQEPGA